MLKPADQQQPGPPERPVGELVHELIEDGKAYARAEIAVVQAIATAKAKAIALPVGLLVTALLVAQAAITVLAVTLLAALSSRLGPVGAGLIAFLVFAGLAGGLAWFAVQKLRKL